MCGSVFADDVDLLAPTDVCAILRVWVANSTRLVSEGKSSPRLPDRGRYRNQHDREFLRPRRALVRRHPPPLLGEVPGLVHGDGRLEGRHPPYGSALASPTCCVRSPTARRVIISADTGKVRQSVSKIRCGLRRRRSRSSATCGDRSGLRHFSDVYCQFHRDAVNGFTGFLLKVSPHSIDTFPTSHCLKYISLRELY